MTKPNTQKEEDHIADLRKKVGEELYRQHGTGHYGCVITDYEINGWLKFIQARDKKRMEEIKKEIDRRISSNMKETSEALAYRTALIEFLEFLEKFK